MKRKFDFWLCAAITCYIANIVIGAGWVIHKVLTQ